MFIGTIKKVEAKTVVSGISSINSQCFAEFFNYLLFVAQLKHLFFLHFKFFGFNVVEM